MSEFIDFENNEDGEAKWLEARKKYISATQTYFAICNFCEDTLQYLRHGFCSGSCLRRDQFCSSKVYRFLSCVPLFE